MPRTLVTCRRIGDAEYNTWVTQQGKAGPEKKWQKPSLLFFFFFFFVWSPRRGTFSEKGAR